MMTDEKGRVSEIQLERSRRTSSSRVDDARRARLDHLAAQVDVPNHRPPLRRRQRKLPTWR